MAEEIFKNIQTNDAAFDKDTSINFTRDEGRKIRALYSIYKCALEIVETKLNTLNAEFSLEGDNNPIHTIQTRMKSPESLMEKCKRRGFEFTADSIKENIKDLAGGRVTFYTIPTIYAIAYRLLMQDDVTVEEVKDYIANPKENGYRSLHMIIRIPVYFTHSVESVPVELQFRTIAMDMWASVDHQIMYKKDLDDENGEAIEKARNKLTEDTELLDRDIEKCYRLSWKYDGNDFEKLFRDTFCN